ncbi:hypothetical protein CHS0354_034551 [Potamilus streckersoni]|uniref:Uncharacterized protein n=1 Tax=Potamilus streckersoni TaxID=2493646 RepID=A0AAE0SUR0_9BIVA|nr:hypothetical protein CHS0354_034551 [Potamilus streckersoni]
MASKQYEAGSPAKPMKKSVKIVEDDVEVIEVGEKHGPLFNAIPRMPIPVAVVCCILNIFVPGLEVKLDLKRRNANGA